jgi:hypothetical protein
MSAIGEKNSAAGGKTQNLGLKYQLGTNKHVAHCCKNLPNYEVFERKTQYMRKIPLKLGRTIFQWPLLCKAA